MIWSVADAKRRFSELLRQAAASPQVVHSRRRPVAAVMGIEEFERYESWRKEKSTRSLADETEDLRRIVQEESYELCIPPREDRAGWDPTDT